MKIETAVICGDGVGPEMMGAALSALKAVCKKYHHELVTYPVCACSKALELGKKPLPEESLQQCLAVPAVLFGNTGLEKYRDKPLQERPEGALMALRKALGVTTNIRPVRYYPELSEFSPLKERVLERGLDFAFVRDIVGGVLCSDKVSGEGKYGREAYEYEYYNEKIVSDTAHIAMKLAAGRRKKVANLDKSNVLASSRLWRQKVTEVAGEYPDIELSHYYIDNAAMRIMETPENFDVLVTSNLFGDIISDEGTQMTGTQYLYGSAELSRAGHAIYTPNQLHHPDESIIGKNIVNPLGMIAAAAMMLRFSFGLEEEARMLEKAVAEVVRNGMATRDIWMPGKRLLGTEEMGQAVCEAISSVIV